MKPRPDSKFFQVFKDLHEHLITRGIKLEYTRLKNEASPVFQRKLKSKDINFQLAPPGTHLCNAAERDIITFKDHFITGLLSKDPYFPMKNCYHLLEHTYITLNLLRPSRQNAKPLLYAQLNGTFYYNITSFPPPRH